jgi:hypothetical protein
MKKVINIVENSISVDIEKLKKIIIDEWQSGSLYGFYYDQNLNREDLHWYILDDLSTYLEDLYDEIEGNAQQTLGLPGATLDLYNAYPRSDKRAIGFRVLSFLEFAWTLSLEEINSEDIPFILEFLDTPEDELTVAWNRWENYWNDQDLTWLALGTGIDGGIQEANETLNKLRNEYEPRKLLREVVLSTKDGGQRRTYYYEDGSRLQLRTNGILSHPKMIIIDFVRKNMEKITFE